MNDTSTQRWLLEQMETLPVVDGHEHLPPEAMRLEEHADALTLFRQYTRLVMFSAGLDEPTFMRIHEPDLSVDERFKIFDRYRDLIRFSGPARAAYIALEKFYGEEELTRDNFDAITEKVRALYRPGIYRKVLCEACHIETALSNVPDHQAVFDGPMLRPVLSLWGFWDEFRELAEKLGRGELEYKNPDEYLEARGEQLLQLVESRVVGFKMTACLHSEPDRQAAEQFFDRLRRGDRGAARTDLPNPLQNYLLDGLLGMAGKSGLPVAVHTGVWGDFRQMDCKEMIPHIARHPEVRFDLFHMGLPSVRDMGRIGANFGNVWLNLCWASTLSPTMAAGALDEWLDQVAVNKIIAFGGDVRWPVEKIYGHLTLAREVVATTLARRVDDKLMLREQALALAKLWFYENPRALYALN
jgi:predicted TIM-barrel fold metal-dependent hydrolase